MPRPLRIAAYYLGFFVIVLISGALTKAIGQDYVSRSTAVLILSLPLCLIYAHLARGWLR
jgi:hypothetical protein